MWESKSTVVASLHVQELTRLILEHGTPNESHCLLAQTEDRTAKHTHSAIHCAS